MTGQRRRVLIQGSGPDGRDGERRTETEPQETCDCPELDAGDWDGVENDWSDIAFLRTRLPALAGVPLRFDTARASLIQRAAELGALVPDAPMLLIGEGRFGRDLLLEIEGAPASAADVIRPGGVAYTRLVHAPWGELSRAAKQLRADAEARYGRKPAALYAWYLTCRVCSRDRNFETLLVAHYPDESG